MEGAQAQPDYHVEAGSAFCSVPHQLIDRAIQIRLTHPLVRRASSTATMEAFGVQTGR
ncbi:hypothetical protein NKI09_30410 [Mesorhizobium sp. M0757]|uniref:hypothetical protein n=1 Tax=unclassified Mesorhizobium TaxID=325217 RepID=UPI00333CFDB1